MGKMIDRLAFEVRHQAHEILDGLDRIDNVFNRAVPWIAGGALLVLAAHTVVGLIWRKGP